MTFKSILAAVLLFCSFTASAVPINPNCVAAAANHVSCDLVANEQAIGVGVAPGSYVTFTNRTTTYLQIDSATAITGERGKWSEFCVYLDNFMVGQYTPGTGEVGCAAKQIGEDYPAIQWGAGTGLSVPPGGVVYLNSNTQGGAINHTFSLMVRNQTTGLHSWRQPQMDKVIECDGRSQATVWATWQNTMGRDLHLTGAQIYSEAGSSVTPNTMNGPACIYVLKANGTPKYTNCDDALRTRGQVSFQTLIVSPGESVAAQATNACAAPAVWDWAAFLQIW